MIRTIDARGLACPQPVIMARDAMRETNEVLVLVSGQDSVHNIQRLAEKSGWQARVEPQEHGYALHLFRGAVAAEEPQLTPEVTACAPRTATVVAVPSDQMGRGEAELGTLLVRSFFHALAEVEPPPTTLVFYNTGVRLVVEDSPILEDLRTLEQKGVEILVCGTCVGYFDLKERVAVGTVSNMYTIAETLLGAGNVVML